MSYILDALKKAERERGLAEVPTLESMHDHPSRMQVRLWLIPGLFMMGIIVALWLFLPSLRPGTTKPRSNPDAPGQVVNQSALVQIRDVPAAVISPQDPYTKEAEVSPPGSNPVLPEMERPRSVVRGQRFNPSYSPSFVPEAVRNPQEIPLRETVERFRPAPSPDPLEQSLSGSAPAKPLPLVDAVAGMTMSIHMFSEEKAERMVFINGRKYLEGDYVDKVYLLESITPEGAVLRFGAERATLRPGGR
jgi:general secretion pathway protein B